MTTHATLDEALGEGDADQPGAGGRLRTAAWVLEFANGQADAVFGIALVELILGR